MANQTLIKFCEHFSNKNKEHLHKITTVQLGYHSANIAIAVAHLNLNSAPAAHSANATIATNVITPPAPVPRAPSGTPYVIMDDGIHMFYCWTMDSVSTVLTPAQCVPMAIAKQQPQ